MTTENAIKAGLTVLLVVGAIALGIYTVVSNYQECRYQDFSTFYCLTTHVFK